MRISDIVSQLVAVLPNLTDRFSTTGPGSTLEVIGSTAILRAPDGLGFEVGNKVTLTGFAFQIGIEFSKADGDTRTLTTTDDHDVTEGFPQFEELSFISDSPEWTGSFPLVSVPNRRTVVVTNSATDLPEDNNTILLDPRSVGGNQVVEILADNGSSGGFTEYTVSFVGGGVADGIYSGGTVEGNPRIAGIVGGSRNLNKMLEQYSQQPADDFWMFVSPNDPARMSFDRRAEGDGVSDQGPGSDLRGYLLEEFSVWVFAPADNEAAGAESMDVCRNDLLGPILQSVRGTNFPTGLSNPTSFRCVFVSHGTAEYDGAIYIHRYDFEMQEELSSEDSYLGPSVAFRDIDATIVAGTQEMDMSLDLDDFPLAPLPPPLAWWDPSNLSTITESGGLVSQIDDLSGNGYNLMTGDEPTTGVETIGGLNAIGFDGLETDLHSLDIANGISSNLTVFLVVNVTAASDPEATVINISKAATNTLCITAGTVGAFFADVVDENLGIGALISPTDLFEEDILLRLELDTAGLASRLYNGDTLLGTSTYDGGLDTPLQVTMALNDVVDKYLGMNMGEVLIYDRILSAEEATTVVNYLETKWFS